MCNKTVVNGGSQFWQDTHFNSMAVIFYFYVPATKVLFTYRYLVCSFVSSILGIPFVLKLFFTSSTQFQYAEISLLVTLGLCQIFHAKKRGVCLDTFSCDGNESNRTESEIRLLLKDSKSFLVKK